MDIKKKLKSELSILIEEFQRLKLFCMNYYYKDKKFSKKEFSKKVIKKIESQLNK